MSNLRFTGRFLTLFIIIFVIYLFLTTTSLVQISRSFRVIHSLRTQGESILLYRAYYDNRTGPGRLRILSISPCLSSSTQLSIGGSTDFLTHSPVEKFCPWKWAPDCQWNAYHFESQPIPFSPTMSVYLSRRSVEMAVHSVPSLNESLEVCVPPLYWYDDWPRLLLFVQFWRKERASISIYVNSVSANVKRVLDFYQSQGVIRVINWPMLPRLKDEDPNRSVYRLSHSLSHNDCVLRSSSMFTLLLDLDEFIIVRNSSLLDFARSKFAGDSSIGSLQFQHRGLVSDIQLDETFDTLNSMEMREVDGPSKVLFNPSSILFLSTHFVNTHSEGFHGTMISTDEAFLLHNRISFGEKNIGDKIEIGDRFSVDLKDGVIETRDEIFGTNPPLFNLNVTNEIIRCTASWRIDGCKTPIHSCYSTLISMEEWIFISPSDDSRFDIL